MYVRKCYRLFLHPLSEEHAYQMASGKLPGTECGHTLQPIEITDIGSTLMDVVTNVQEHVQSGKWTCVGGDSKNCYLWDGGMNVYRFHEILWSIHKSEPDPGVLGMLSDTEYREKHATFSEAKEKVMKMVEGREIIREDLSGSYSLRSKRFYSVLLEDGTCFSISTLE
jgi:hypothetical protein